MPSCVAIPGCHLNLPQRSWSVQKRYRRVSCRRIAMLGIVIHVLLSMVFGVAFLAALALIFQLSARPLADACIRCAVRMHGLGDGFPRGTSVIAPR